MSYYKLVRIICLIALIAYPAFGQADHPKTGKPLIVQAYRGTPTLDGNLNDWPGVEPCSVDTEEQIYNMFHGKWNGPEDCSGKFYLMWDNEKIYLAAEILDDKIVAERAGGSIWQTDCVEIFFSRSEAKAGHDHYQFGADPKEQKWNWCNMDGAGQSEPDFMEVAATETNNGYIIETSYEIASLKALKSLIKVDEIIGFHPVMDDCDTKGSDRKLQITWTGLEAHDQSTGFGQLVFSDETAPVNPADKLAATWAFIKTK